MFHFSKHKHEHEHFQVGPDGETHIRVGKLNMVDLAGSERQAKTGAKVLELFHNSYSGKVSKKII